MDSQNGNANNGLARNLSMFAVWGLSFGYAVGWGAFVMPGAEFLPSAGPAGTAIGILIGTLAMAVIGADPALASLKVCLFTADVEMNDTYAEKGFDGILLKPASMDALRKLLP